MKLLLSLTLALIINIVSIFSQNDNLSYIADPYDSNKYHIQNNYNQTVGFLILDSYNQKEANVYDSNMNFIQKISFAENKGTSVFDPGTGQSEQLQVRSSNFSVNPDIAPLGNESILRGIELNDRRAARRQQQSNRDAEIQANYILQGYDALKREDYRAVISYLDRVNERKHPHLKCDKYTLLTTTLILLNNPKYKEYYNIVQASCPSDVTVLLNRLIAEMN